MASTSDEPLFFLILLRKFFVTLCSSIHLLLQRFFPFDLLLIFSISFHFQSHRKTLHFTFTFEAESIGHNIFQLTLLPKTKTRKKKRKENMFAVPNTVELPACLTWAPWICCYALVSSSLTQSPSQFRSFWIHFIWHLFRNGSVSLTFTNWLETNV